MPESAMRSWDHSFFFVVAILVSTVIVFGFRTTIGDNLIHPDWPRPPLLWIHAALFASWIPLFVAQTGLIRFGHVRWHRCLGMWTLAIGVAIPIVGIVATLLMAHLRAQRGAADAAGFMPIGLADMFSFALAFGAGVLARKQREVHRRLMFLATCALAAAGFLRLLQPVLPGPYSGFLGASALILLAMARDLLVDRRVHPVYMVALPLYVSLEAAAVHISTDPGWLRMGNTLIH